MSTIPLRIHSFRRHGPVSTIVETFKCLPFADMTDQDGKPNRMYHAPILNMSPIECDAYIEARTPETAAFQSFVADMHHSTIQSALSAGRGSQRRRGSILDTDFTDASSEAHDAPGLLPRIIAHPLDSLPSILEHRPNRRHELSPTLNHANSAERVILEDFRDNILRADKIPDMVDLFWRTPRTEVPDQDDYYYTHPSVRLVTKRQIRKR